MTKKVATKKAPAKSKAAKSVAPERVTQGYSMAKLKRRSEDVLSEKAKARRQLFALAYVQKGFNGHQAALAIGIPRASARKQASEMCAEPYTQELIEKLKMELLADTARMGNLIRLGQFREAHYEGAGASHGARVSAFAHLAKMFGVDAPTSTDPGLAPSGVMEIPLAGSMEEWTQASTLSQTKLMADVRK